MDSIITDYRQIEKRHVGSERMAMLALYVFLANITVKYFVPSIVTKILPIIAVGILFLVNRRNAFKIPKYILGYFVFAIIYLGGALYSALPLKGLLYALSLIIAIFFVSNALRCKIDWRKVFIAIAVICVVMTIGTILQSFGSPLLGRVTAIFPYSVEDRLFIQAWAKNRWFCGLFPDRAPAAFFSSMLCGVGLYSMLKKEKEERRYIRLLGVALYALGVWGILLTAKRGLLFGMLFATFVCYLVNRYTAGKPILLVIIASIFFSLAGYFIVSRLSVAEVMINRIFSSDDFYTHRMEIYRRIIENVKTHFLLGTGTASADALLGVGGHNIYLTVLMENGIIGAVTFVIVWGGELVRTIKGFVLVKGEKKENIIALLSFSLFVQVFFITYGMSGNPLYDNYILNFYFLGVLMNENVRYQFQKAKNCYSNIPISI